MHTPTRIYWFKSEINSMKSVVWSLKTLLGMNFKTDEKRQAMFVEGIIADQFRTLLNKGGRGREETCLSKFNTFA